MTIMLTGCAVQALADECDMFTGAELAGLCREAAITALREDLQASVPILAVAGMRVICHTHGQLRLACVFKQVRSYWATES